MVLPLIMQAFSLNSSTPCYTGLMKRGRPSNRPRTDFGKRIFDARTAKGLSQAQVADALGVSQASYGVWERDPVALRPDQVEKLSKLLGVSVAYLFGEEGKKQSGPKGKARLLFEEVSALPRSQQAHVLTVVEAFVKQHQSG